MDFKKLEEYMDSLSDRYDIPGADVSVYCNHKELYRHQSGHRDIDRTQKVREDDLYILYSMTKVLTVTAALQLVEQGKLSLCDNVSKYIGEFEKLTYDDNGVVKECPTPMTVKNLFTMTSGLTYDLGMQGIKEVIGKKGDNATTREIVGAFAKTPLAFLPSTHFRYSLSHDVLGAIIEVVSGMSFGEYLKKNIFAPLGMNEITFDFDSLDLSRFTALYTYNNEEGRSEPTELKNIYRLSKKYESGGAGLYSTLADYAKFADAMACGGVSKDGYRILSEKTIDLMRTPHIDGVVKSDFDKMNKTGYSYGLGVRTMFDKTIGIPSKSPIGEFGWDGAGGCYVAIDVENGISIVYAQQVRGCQVAYREVHPTIRNLVYEAMGL